METTVFHRQTTPSKHDFYDTDDDIISSSFLLIASTL